MRPEFLSGEASASPAVEPLLEGARRLAKLGVGSGALAARNGLRTTTNANVPFEMLTDQDFVEVADYDPHLDRLLVIGKRDPQPHAGMVALMLRAKREVGALALLEVPEAQAKFPALPHTKRGHRPLENAMAALEALRGRDAAVIGNHVVVTGRSVREMLARAEALLEAPK